MKLPIATPIELQHFIARCVQEGQQVRFVELTRSTLSETNNAGFRVQKSDDGETRVNVAWIPGAGTSRDIENYSFIDPKGTD